MDHGGKTKVQNMISDYNFDNIVNNIVFLSRQTNKILTCCDIGRQHCVVLICTNSRSKTHVELFM